MARTIDDFRDAWAHVRGQLTYDFAAAVPDASWREAPDATVAPFAKQLRHVVCVHGVYLTGLRDHTVDFRRKHSYYRGPLDRAALVDALRAMDAETDSVLAELAPDEETFRLDFFGSDRSLGRYLATWIQHESLHHGQWSLYARLAGFETPPSWRLNWDL